MALMVASPACPVYSGGHRTRNRRSAGQGPDRPCRWRAYSWATTGGAPMSIRAPWTWLGATPHLGKRRLAAGRMEPDSPIVPAAPGSLPSQQSFQEGGRALLRGGRLPARRPRPWCPSGRAPGRFGCVRAACVQACPDWPSRTGLLDREATPGGGWDGRAHPNPRRCRMRHAEQGFYLQGKTAYAHTPRTLDSGVERRAIGGRSFSPCATADAGAPFSA